MLEHKVSVLEKVLSMPKKITPMLEHEASALEKKGVALRNFSSTLKKITPASEQKGAALKSFSAKVELITANEGCFAARGKQLIVSTLSINILTNTTSLRVGKICAKF